MRAFTSSPAGVLAGRRPASPMQGSSQNLLEIVR
jgi:hypothetical protein